MKTNRIMNHLRILPGFFNLRTIRESAPASIERVPLPYEIPSAPVPLPQDLNLEELESLSAEMSIS